MSGFRDIDQRDLDALLRAFTDVQIADLYGLPVREVAAIRQRRNKLEADSPDDHESTSNPNMRKHKTDHDD
jgi:hypothetical protein